VALATCAQRLPNVVGVRDTEELPGVADQGALDRTLVGLDDRRIVGGFLRSVEGAVVTTARRHPAAQHEQTSTVCHPGNHVRSPSGRVAGVRARTRRRRQFVFAVVARTIERKRK
jgi:hypothetical protein